MLELLADKIREEGKIETARKMKSKGLDILLISEITGLSVDEIKKLWFNKYFYLAPIKKGEKIGTNIFQKDLWKG